MLSTSLAFFFQQRENKKKKSKKGNFKIIYLESTVGYMLWKPKSNL